MRSTQRQQRQRVAATTKLELRVSQDIEMSDRPLDRFHGKILAEYHGMALTVGGRNPHLPEYDRHLRGGGTRAG